MSMAPQGMEVLWDRAPRTLYVDMQGDHDMLGAEGSYELQQDVEANSMPVWKKQAKPERWLFSNTVGQWCIHGDSAKAAQFQIAAAWVWLNEKHDGQMPHAYPRGWLVWGSCQPEASSLTVTRAPCRAVALTVTEYDFGDMSVTCRSLAGEELATLYIADASAETSQSILTQLAQQMKMEEHELGAILPNGTMLKLREGCPVQTLAELFCDKTGKGIEQMELEERGDAVNTTGNVDCRYLDGWDLS